MSNQTEMVWDLTKLVKGFDDPAINEIIANFKGETNELQQEYQGKIESAPFSEKDIFTLLQKLESLFVNFFPVRQFANLSVSADQTNSEALKLKHTIDETYSKSMKKLTFVEIELGNLLKKKPDLLKKDVLSNYKHFLTILLEKQPHVLSEKEEMLIIDKDSHGIDEWQNLQQKWLATRKFHVIIDGKPKEITWGDAFGFFRHNKREVRKEVMTKSMNQLIADSEIFSYCLRSICSDHVKTSKTRGYSNPMEPSLIANDVTQKMIDSLINSVEANLVIYQEFLKLKGNILGTGNILLGEDLWAPIPTKEEKEYSWEEAKNMVLNCYKDFDREFGSYAEEMFTSNRIDAIVRNGKRSGAFCASDHKNRAAYILLSYTGKISDVQTLAHEMGHAIHAYHYLKHQTILNTQLSMALAETASEFGSFLLHEQIAKENDLETKRSRLMSHLNDLMTVIFEVASRTRFEQKLYGSIEQGKYLEAETIREIFKEVRLKYFGESVQFLEQQHWDWIWKPHYYMSNFRFYNYPYVFAEMIVLSLFAKYKQEGKTFIPKYKEFLKTGSSKSPYDQIKEIFDLDLSKSEFWNLGMNELKKMLEEVKNLYNQ